MNDLIFYIALSFYFTHQADAFRCSEWRILPGFSALNDGVAARLFVAIHLPVYIAIFWCISSNDPQLTYYFQLSLDVMLAGHIGKHFFLQHHEKNEFNELFSKLLIFFTSLFAFMHLGLILQF